MKPKRKGAARQEPQAATVVHGVTCTKVPHVGGGWMHDKDQDGPYDVDGCTYCGRCHVYINHGCEKLPGRAARPGTPKPEAPYETTILGNPATVTPAARYDPTLDEPAAPACPRCAPEPCHGGHTLTETAAPGMSFEARWETAPLFAVRDRRTAEWFYGFGVEDGRAPLLELLRAADLQLRLDGHGRKDGIRARIRAAVGSGEGK